MNELLTMFTFEKLYNLTINMLSQREIRFQKRKIIGESFLRNVYDKVRCNGVANCVVLSPTPHKRASRPAPDL